MERQGVWFIPLYNCVADGLPDKTISDLDSNGALWLKKTDLNENNATPFVLLCSGFYD